MFRWTVFRKVGTTDRLYTRPERDTPGCIGQLECTRVCQANTKGGVVTEPTLFRNKLDQTGAYSADHPKLISFSAPITRALPCIFSRISSWDTSKKGGAITWSLELSTRHLPHPACSLSPLATSHCNHISTCQKGQVNPIHADSDGGHPVAIFLMRWPETPTRIASGDRKRKAVAKQSKRRGPPLLLRRLLHFQRCVQRPCGGIFCRRSRDPVKDGCTNCTFRGRECRIAGSFTLWALVSWNLGISVYPPPNKSRSFYHFRLGLREVLHFILLSTEQFKFLQ